MYEKPVTLHLDLLFNIEVVTFCQNHGKAHAPQLVVLATLHFYTDRGATLILRGIISDSILEGHMYKTLFLTDSL